MSTDQPAGYLSIQHLALIAEEETKGVAVNSPAKKLLNQKNQEELNFSNVRTFLRHMEVALKKVREFSTNANVSATTKVLAFLVTKGYNPRISFDSVDLSADLTREKIANSMAKSIVNRMEEV